MKVAAMDLGTNSFLCLIAEVCGEEVIPVEDHIEIVRLGENVQRTGAFSKGALERAEACLKNFKKQIEQASVEKIAAVATSAARDASNGAELLKIGQNLSIPIDIIEGEKEAEYTFNGVLSGKNKNKEIVVVDIGGGSTEFAYYEKKQIRVTSLNLGCVRHTEKYLDVEKNSAEQLKKFYEIVQEELARIETPKVKEVVAVAGTPTTLACVKRGKPFDPSWAEDSELTVKDLREMEKQFASTSLEERKRILGMEPKRADVILSGTIILRMVTEKFGFRSVRVSTRGVRYGLALAQGGTK